MNVLFQGGKEQIQIHFTSANRMCTREQKLYAEIATLNQQRGATSPRNSFKSLTVLANKADAVMAGASGQQNWSWAQPGALLCHQGGAQSSSLQLLSDHPCCLRLWSAFDLDGTYPWSCIFSTVWLEFVILYSQTIRCLFVCLLACFFPPNFEPYHYTYLQWLIANVQADKTIKISSPQHVWGTQTRCGICK